MGNVRLMRAAVLESHDAPPRAGKFEEPRAGDGEAVIEVAVAGLNPVDIYTASGDFPGRVPPLPSVVGHEGIGTLAGRRVYFDRPIAPFGSMAERALVDAEALIDVPDEVEDGLAVSFGIAGLAAWLGLTWRGRLQEGETVLVLGASGVVGQVAIQGAALLGAGRVVAATRSEDGLRRAAELGADETVQVREGEELAERFREASGGGADLVIDPIWGEPAMAALRSVADDGRLVQIGNAAGPTAELAARPFRNQLASVIGHTNFKAPQQLKAEAFAQMCRHAVAGELDVETEGFDLDRIGEAWERQQQAPHHKLFIRCAS
jgi:NADPH:quinone reductase-like Zn-dependent oxidoreductase